MNNEVFVSDESNQAVRNVQLIEVERELTQEAGFKWPVKISESVYDLVNPSQEAQEYGEDIEKRLWNLLTLAKDAIKQAPTSEQLVCFLIKIWHAPGNSQNVTLWATLDLTDSPAIHIIKPEEY